jgi:hypothetical protein
VDLKDFDFMFPKLQNNPNNLLPESSATPANLARLGKTMVDIADNDEAGDSDVAFFAGTLEKVYLLVS